MSALTIDLPRDLQEHAESLAAERGESVEELLTTVLRKALEAEIHSQDNLKARALEIARLARQRSETSPALSDAEWNRRFDAVSEAMLQQAIAKGTAIEERLP
jgi:hypothetical protein